MDNLELTIEDKRQVVGKLLKKMWTGGHFDICAVDKSLLILGLRRPACYDQWHAMHCVNWSDMPDTMPEKLMASVIKEMTGQTMHQIIDAAFSGKETTLLLKAMENG